MFLFMACEFGHAHGSVEFGHARGHVKFGRETISDLRIRRLMPRGSKCCQQLVLDSTHIVGNGFDDNVAEELPTSAECCRVSGRPTSAGAGAGAGAGGCSSGNRSTSVSDFECSW